MANKSTEEPRPLCAGTGVMGGVAGSDIGGTDGANTITVVTMERAWGGGVSSVSPDAVCSDETADGVASHAERVEVRASAAIAEAACISTLIRTDAATAVPVTVSTGTPAAFAMAASTASS